MGLGHHREGIVLRPLEEYTDNNGKRLICKHKRDEFRETTQPRPIMDPAKLKILSEAKAIADEWVTIERLNHLLTSGEIETKIENTGEVIKKMIDDILKEGSGEIIDSKEARTQIGKNTAILFKQYINSRS